MGTGTRWLRNVWRLLGSIRLAAALLFALLLASMLASLFPQMPDDPSLREPWLAVAQLRLGPAAWFWQGLGLFDLYRSPLFLVLLAALLLNTLACTVQRILALCRSLTRAPVVTQSIAFYQEAPIAAEWPVGRRDEAVEIVQQGLARRGYRVCVDHEAQCAHLYAERGKWARLGSPVSHAAAFAFFLALLVRPALRWEEYDPTFWVAVVALSVFLIATLAALRMPHRRLWLRIDAACAWMVGVGDFGIAFDRLAGVLSETCREGATGSDG